MFSEINTTRLEHLLGARRGRPDPRAVTSDYLIVIGPGDRPIAMHRMGPDGTLVGRSVESALQLPAPSVSRNHAVLSTDEEGTVWLTDLGSTNGSFLNGDRVAPHEPIRLDPGGRIQFGESSEVRFVRLNPDEERFHLSLYERAIRDGLTGLLNRTFFLDRMTMLIQAGPTAGPGVGVILLDIDHFKAVNDEHGHDAGDDVLRAVGCLLRESSRPEDLLARYGGEEFIVGLSVRSADIAVALAERIRENLAARPFEAAEKLLRVTASLGISFAPTEGSIELHDLIAEADRRLYRAKGEGRNRVVGPP